MQQHRRFPQPQDLEGLAEEAKRLREEAELLPSGALRKQVLLKARQAQRESHMIKWLSLVRPTALK
jgi:hypothetical protein